MSKWFWFRWPDYDDGEDDYRFREFPNDTTPEVALKSFLAGWTLNCQNWELGTKESFPSLETALVNWATDTGKVG